nr:hypothetical protein [Tanacetum cinerariifolium]
MDVKTAFLNGLVTKEVFVVQPDGFVDPDHLEKVYRLRKSIYGLKQAPKAWYDELLKFMTSKGFTKDKGQSIGTPMAMKPKLDADLSGNPVDQTDYRDVDHAGCIDSHKSTSGGIQFLVSWMLKKQNCTAMSSVEAEYVALSASCAQVMWMRTQLQDYGFNYNKIPLYCDSQSAITILCNPRTALSYQAHPYSVSLHKGTALPEDRFKYLVRRISMRCLTPAELEILANESA